MVRVNPSVLIFAAIALNMAPALAVPIPKHSDDPDGSDPKSDDVKDDKTDDPQNTFVAGLALGAVLSHHGSDHEADEEDKKPSPEQSFAAGLALGAVLGQVARVAKNESDSHKEESLDVRDVSERSSFFKRQLPFPYLPPNRRDVGNSQITSRDVPLARRHILDESLFKRHIDELD